MHSSFNIVTFNLRALALNCNASVNAVDGAVAKNWQGGKPVRVLRSAKGRKESKYCPEDGLRYDGIYKVSPPHLSITVCYSFSISNIIML